MSIKFLTLCIARGTAGAVWLIYLLGYIYLEGVTPVIYDVIFTLLSILLVILISWRIE